jgi:hypothetical protein
MFSKILILALPYVGLFAASASAQDFIPNMNTVDYNLPQYATEGLAPMTRAINKVAAQQPRMAFQRIKTQKSSALGYTLVAARTRTNLAKFVEKTRATDPAGADKMSQLFASTDIIGMIDQKMQQTYGMRANNVADAYAVWWVSAWMGSKGRSDDATPGQMAMVKRQASNALASTPEFASATDAGKQELAEALLVQAALIGDTIDTYASDPAMLAKTRAAIAKGASGMGLDLGKMTLTDQGFVPSGKTGAADPAPGAAEQALAANAAATPPVAANDTSPPYILLAAAGGAGLGGVFLLGKLVGKRG